MQWIRPPLADTALALGLSGLAAGEAVAGDATTASLVLAAALPLPLAWRRVSPVGAALAVVVVVAIDALTGGEGLELVAATLAIVLAVYSLGAHAALRPGLAALGACLLVGWASVSASDDATASDYAFAAVVVLASWAVGRVAGGRLATAVAERERADLAAADERARIARELHDIVAHSVGVIVVQAGAAEQVLESEPETARQALADIRRTGKEALVDLRRMLGLLREGEAATDVAPQPGLDDLARLAERVRQAGLAVELRVEGSRRPVPAGIALTAYRVAQEALTNVLKHADAARADVVLRYGGESLELSVADDGRQAPAAGRGHGLVGMRERVTLFGGELEAGPRASGGFRVHVRLPYA
jgi:signal transduction histidine kinase